MLENVEPSISLTGGPWYNESELDTAFIEDISKACLKFIRDVVRLLSTHFPGR
jgi:DNA-directed RNA polymerase III subunit RPC6